MSKKKFVAGFLSGLFTYQIQKPEYVDTSGVATPATLNEPVLSTVFEIPRWSIHCYGPTMVNLLYVLNMAVTVLVTFAEFTHYQCHI